MRRPHLVVVCEDAQRLEELAEELKRRYEPDYQVACMASASDALARLAGLRQAGAEAALVIADERLAQMPAVGFLARAHELHPGAKRVLLSSRGDWSPMHTAVGAVARAPAKSSLVVCKSVCFGLRAVTRRAASAGS